MQCLSVVTSALEVHSVPKMHDDEVQLPSLFGRHVDFGGPPCAEPYGDKAQSRICPTAASTLEVHSVRNHMATKFSQGLGPSAMSTWCCHVGFGGSPCANLDGEKVPSMTCPNATVDNGSSLCAELHGDEFRPTHLSFCHVGFRGLLCAEPYVAEVCSGAPCARMPLACVHGCIY